MTKDTVVLYHDNCADGLTSAWQAWRHLHEEAEYIPVMYKVPIPDVAKEPGKTVYILDFSYPVEVLTELAKTAKKIVVLDHHKTAEEEIGKALHLNGLPNVNIYFDMNMSGATLTQSFFEGHADNWWVKYVEDRDLWRFALPNSQAINAFIQSVPRTILDYELAYTAETPESALAKGQGALVYLDLFIRETARQARLVTFEGYRNVAMVNTPFTGMSEVLGFLAKTHVFAMGWCQRADGGISYSLRSVGDFDVSELAKKHGGGGHYHAAGFSTSSEDKQLMPFKDSRMNDDVLEVIEP